MWQAGDWQVAASLPRSSSQWIMLWALIIFSMGKHRTHSICRVEPSQMNSIRSRMCFVNYSQLHLHFSTNLCHLSSHSHWPRTSICDPIEILGLLSTELDPQTPTSSHDNLLMKQRFTEGFTIVQLPCCFTPPLLGKSLWYSQSLVRKIFSQAFPSHSRKKLSIRSML